MTNSDELKARTIKKLYWRLLPFLLLCYLAAYLDRVNVGFAALHMNSDLGFTPTMYAIGGGIFFVGYLIFEIPSNWMIEKVGARIWIARILITWGLISTATAFIQGSTSFYIIRFFLGAAEAGFLPGVILYLTKWFPAEHRSKVLGLFILGIPLSFIVGSPVSGMLLGMDGTLGLKGWQWLFLLEGVPPVLLGVMCIWLLADSPAKAKWLEAEEREWINGILKAEAVSIKDSPHSFSGALRSVRVWLFGLAYIGIVSGMYGVSLWLPQIVKAFGMTDVRVGFVTAIPYLVAAVVLVLWARHSDQTGERRWHALVPCVVGAAGLAASTMTGDPVLSMVSFTIALSGVLTSMPIFWTLPSAFLTGPAAAAGIALINCIGNVGGFAGPYLVGYVRQTTNSFGAAMLLLAGFLLVTAVLLFTLSKRSSQRYQLGHGDEEQHVGSRA